LRLINSQRHFIHSVSFTIVTPCCGPEGETGKSGQENRRSGAHPIPGILQSISLILKDTGKFYNVIKGVFWSGKDNLTGFKIQN